MVGILFSLYLCRLHCLWSIALINHLDCPLGLPPSPRDHQTLSVSPSPSCAPLPWSVTITLISLSFLHHGRPKNPPTHMPSHAWRPYTLHLHARVIGSGLVTCEWPMCLFLQMPGRVAGWNPSTSQTTASLSWLQGNSMEMWRKTKVSSARKSLSALGANLCFYSGCASCLPQVHWKGSRVRSRIKRTIFLKVATQIDSFLVFILK